MSKLLGIITKGHFHHSHGHSRVCLSTDARARPLCGGPARHLGLAPVSGPTWYDWEDYLS